MKSAISKEALDQVFTEARTYRSWRPQEVSNATLKEIYNLMKWGPTSANCCPARIVFVKTGPMKEKLISCLDAGNIEKVKEAPVTAILAQDEKFYEFFPKLSPHSSKLRDSFATNKNLAEVTAFRNSTLQGAYLMLAARALGLDCGPLSGFSNEKVDQLFFAGTSWKSNFLCNLGYGDPSKLHPRAPRLEFDEACRIE